MRTRPGGIRRLLVAVLVALSLSACGGSDGSTTSPERKAADAGEKHEDARTKWVSQVVDCLRARGWEALLTPDGSGFTNDSLKPSQHPAFTTDREECQTLAGPQPGTAPITAKQAGQIYEQLLVTRSCLELLGFTISEPPSRASFVDDYLHHRAPWHPYADLPRELSPATWRNTNEACPQPG